MDFEFLIYILIALVYLIFSVMGRKNKKKPTAPKTRPVTFEDALQELERTMAGETPAESEDPPPPVWSPPAAVPKTVVPPKPPAERIIPMSPTPLSTDSVSPRPQSPIIGQLRNPSSARSAVILSEVLRKPLSLRRR